MIEKVLIISLIVFAIHYSMMEGEIFSFIGDFLEKALPKKLHQPAFDCVVCMAPWYGTAVYWILFRNSWMECIAVVMAAMGLNSILGKLTAGKDE